MSTVPTSRPQQDRAASLQTLAIHGITDEFALLGIRGYYLQTMGDPTKNDRNIYDDAIVLITPSAYITFNANADPSAFRTRIANLVPGKYLYKIGIHGLNRPAAKRYEALVQASEVTVERDGAGRETGWFGINIHRGGYNTTSSLGCQTIHPSQWDAFMGLVRQELKRHGRKTIPYVLTSNG